jgi:hypothetical protein
MKELPQKTRRFFHENRRFFEIFLGFAYQGKDIIVFRFIIEYYSSLRDFGP